MSNTNCKLPESKLEVRRSQPSLTRSFLTQNATGVHPNSLPAPHRFSHHLHTKPAPYGPWFVPIRFNTNIQRCDSKQQVGRSHPNLRLEFESGSSYVPRSPVLSPHLSGELSAQHEASTVHPTTIVPNTNCKLPESKLEFRRSQLTLGVRGLK